MPDKKRGFGRGVDVAQEQATEAAKEQLPSWLRGGYLAQDVVFGSGVTLVRIQHRLERRPSGWLVLRLRQKAGDFNVFFEGGADDLNLTLSRDAQNADPCTVDVWIY